jgi:hypothetical protein
VTIDEARAAVTEICNRLSQPSILTATLPPSYANWQEYGRRALDLFTRIHADEEVLDEAVMFVENWKRTQKGE